MKKEAEQGYWEWKMETPLLIFYLPSNTFQMWNNVSAWVYCPEPPTQWQTCFGSYIIASVPFEWRKTEKRWDVHASHMVGDPCWVPVNVWTWLIALAALCSVIVCLCLCGWRLAHSAPQEFKSDKEQGQTRLNAVLTYGEQLSSVVPADRMEAIRTKTNAAKDDWKSLMDSLQRRETALQVELRRDE